MPWYPCCCVPVEECRLIATTSGGNTLCAKESSIYTLTISGLTNDSCSSCADWNGTFDLQYMFEARWDSPPSASTNCGHTAGDPLWRLEYDAATSYYILTALGIGFRWRLAKASWTCAGTNTLSLVYPLPVPAPCATLPATLALTPCITVCTCCSSGMPASISVTFSGIANNLCDGCTGFNATFLLARSSTCHWYRDGTWSCSAAIGTPKYSIQAWVETSAYANTKFWVWLSFGSIILPSVRSAGYDWVYDKGSGGALDCSGTYTPTLSRVVGAGHNQCTWAMPTCQIN